MAVSVQPSPCVGAVCAVSSLLSDATPPSPDATDTAAACAFRRRLSSAREAVEDGLWPCDVEEGVRVAAALCREECYAHSDTRVASEAAQLLCAVALRMHESSAGPAAAGAGDDDDDDEDTTAAVAGTLHQTAHLLHVLSRHYCSRVRRTALTCALRLAQHTRLPAKHLLAVLNAALPRLHDPDAGVREASLRCLLCASERLGRLSRERLGTVVHDELLARLMFVVRDADVGVRLRGAQLLSTCVHASEAQLLSCLAQEDLAPEAATAAAASGGLDSVGLMMLGLEDDNAGVRQAVLTSMCRLGLSAEQPHFAETAVTFVIDACFDESPGVRMEALRCVGEWGRTCILDEGQVKTVLDCLIADEPGVLQAVLAVLGRLRFTDHGTLLSCVESLLAILSTDTMGPVYSSVWQALARLGAAHPSVSELLPAIVPASGMIGGGGGGGGGDGRAWTNLTSAARTGILKLFSGSPVALAALPSDSPLFLSLAQTNPEAVYELLGCGGDGPAAKRRRLCDEGASTLATLGALAGAARLASRGPAAAAAAASAAKAAASLRGPLWLCEAASAVAAWVARRGERQAAAAATAALVRVLLCVAPLPPKVASWVQEMLARVAGDEDAAGAAAAAAASQGGGDGHGDDLPAGWGVRETSAGMVARPVHEWRRWNGSAYIVRGRVQSARAHAPPAVRVRAAGSEQRVSCRLLSASPTSAHQWEMSWRVDVPHAGGQAGDSLVLVAVVPNTLTASPAEVCVSRTPAVVPKV